jgi:hypothetical protein
MEPHTLLGIIAVFACIASIALLIQAGFLIGIYKTTRGLEDDVRNVLPKVESLLETSRTAVEDGRRQMAEITAKTGDILETTRKQLARVDEVLEDAAARARIQLDRAEMVPDDTMNRAQETVALVHGGIMKPLREIQGVAAGIRTAFQFLMRGGRPNPSQATADEEMFI